MNGIDFIKSKLVDKLWLPIVHEGGSVFYPRLRKNKKMRIFTLTNDRNYQEIDKLIENKITEKERVIGWTYSLQKRFRLEAYTGCTVEGGFRYEESTNIASSLQGYFPFDVINLDFSSQNPYFENGRTEKEINSLEETIQLQKEKQGKQNGFVLIYTILLNSKKVDKELVLRNSNAIRVRGWAGLQLSNFQDTIIDQSEKINFIERLIEEFINKYSYSMHKKEKKTYCLFSTTKAIFSTIGIMKR